MPKRKASEDMKVPGSSKAKKAQDDLVHRANGLAITSFKARYVDEHLLTYRPSKSEEIYRLDLEPAASLSSDELTACFNLIEETSRPDYESSYSFGWHPKQKKEEMKEVEMRYLLVRQHDDETIHGFLSFMVTRDSVPLVPVLYIYEVHLAESLRGIGLGPHLMHVVEGIANRIGVEKLMLTCFLSNSKAHGFYLKRGYIADECTPQDRKTRGKVVKADHVIMSKSLWEDA